MRFHWTRLALADFESAHDYIAQDNPQAATEVAERILAATRRLLDYPLIGRVGEDESTREWQVQHTPYVLVYRIHGDDVELLHVWHNRRDSYTKQK